MEVDIIKIFVKSMMKMDDNDYLRAIILYHTAPVALEYRPGVLLSFANNRRKIYDTWRDCCCDIRLSPNIEYYELNNTSNSVIVLFYNRMNLIEVLSNNENMEFLRGLGYSNSLDLQDYLMDLSLRFRLGCPHEVGMFLGIPLEDINKFIENKGNGYIESGYWKVYSNLDSAHEVFKNCDEAKLAAAKAILGYYQ